MNSTESRSSSRGRVWALRIVRGLGIITPFVWIFYQIELESLRRAFAAIPFWVLLPTLVLPVVPMALQGTRWWILLRTSLPSLSIGKTLECHFAASYYGLVLPGASAQEVVRALMLSRQVEYAVVWGATWVSKILGLVGWILVGLVGWGMTDPLFASQNKDMAPILWVSALFMVLLLAASFSKTLTRPLREVVEQFVPPSFLEKVASVRDAIYLYRTEYKALISAILLTVILQLILIFGTSIVIYAISGVFYFWPFALVLALIEITVVILPLTPGGIGIREGLMAWLFESVGIGIEEVGIYIALSFLGNIARLVGGIPVAMGRVGRSADRDGID